MDHKPYIPGLGPFVPGPLSRFLPPLEMGVVSAWLPDQAKPGAWLLDPFGFSPLLVLEAARAGYRVLVTVNNPINKLLLEMYAAPPAEEDFHAALADLAVIKKGDERLQAHLQSLYLTTCENCGNEIQATSFLWRKEEDTPYARVYKCPHCGDEGERVTTQEDMERAKKIKSTDGLHRSRAFERVAALDDEDRIYAEEAISHYLPRPLYFLTTVINRIDGLNLPKERKRALDAMILVACDAGNTLWGHPTERPRPKQLNIPNQYREHNLWMMLEQGSSIWTETGSGVVLEAWPNKIPESGGVCIYEGRLKELAHEVKKEIPIAAVIGSIPRPNQAFWTLSALWAGWLWGREAVEPFKIALRRRRYDWSWNATALHAAFTHLFELLPLGTPCFGLMPEPEPPFLTSVLTAAGSGGFDLNSLALRTEHDPVQLVWSRGENLKREENDPEIEDVREAIRAHLTQRGEPASYLHIHAAGLISLVKKHALKKKDDEFDDALRKANNMIQKTLSEDKWFVHYSSGENVDTGMWGISDADKTTHHHDSLSDQIEVAIVTYLQKNPDSILLDIEHDLYPRFPGLMTPSKAMVYAVLVSYAVNESSAWKLRPEDLANARRNELNTITAMLEAVGKRLDYETRKEGKIYVWVSIDNASNDKSDPEPGTGGEKQISFLNTDNDVASGVARAFYILASGLVGRAMNESDHPAGKTIIIIPGGRASLVAYKAQRDPSLAARLKDYRLVKYRLLRALFEVPVLTRDTFEEQIASDPLEKSKSQMMMF